MLIPNTYYKISFTTENNVKEYGYLFELKINNNIGKFKILKSL